MQHPRERHHPIGTVRIARLGLENVHVNVLHEPSDVAPASLPPDAGLLYPDPGAIELSTLEPAERPTDLIVIDGTWSQAHTVYRDNPWLQNRPHFELHPDQASRYRLRKEPSHTCLSTIEAIVGALRLLEPETEGLDGLLTSFDSMIDRQIELTARRRTGARRPVRPRTQQGLPRCVVERPERVVLVSFESAPRQDRARDPLALIHVAAWRPTADQVFSQLVRPPKERFPGAQHLEAVALEAVALNNAGDATALGRAWDRFIDKDDILVAWNQSTLDALDTVIELPQQRVHLKSAYRSHEKSASGSLAAQVASLALQVPSSAALMGRAGHQVSLAAAMLNHMVERHKAR